MDYGYSSHKWKPGLLSHWQLFTCYHMVQVYEYIFWIIGVLCFLCLTTYMSSNDGLLHVDYTCTMIRSLLSCRHEEWNLFTLATYVVLRLVRLTSNGILVNFNLNIQFMFNTSSKYLPQSTGDVSSKIWHWCLPTFLTFWINTGKI